MGNVLRVFRRDILRLIKTPPALVVVLALILLPSVYTWYNVAGFWNPYDHTGQLRVCVVNEDAGGESEITGPLDIGDEVVAQLQANDQLDWQFMDYDEAMAQLSSGQSYAAFVMPSSFTADFLTLATGSFTQPQLDYYVNEKLGPVAPKITDTGASTLDESINSAFVATVSDAVANAIDERIDEGERELASAQSQAATRLGETLESLAQARSDLAAMAATASSARSGLADARAGLDQASWDAEAASKLLEEAERQAEELREALARFSDDLLPGTSRSLGQASDALAEARLAEALVPEADAEGFRQAADQAAQDAGAASDALFDAVLPALDQALTRLGEVTASLSSSLANQQLLISQGRLVLDELDAVLQATDGTLAQADSLLADLEGQLGTVRDDVLALSGAGALTELFGEDGLDAARIAEFMGSPTEVVTEQLYPLNAYGAAMAPLFMNLTFWIGAFMLLVILKQEVDPEGIRRLTAAQAYLGRFLLYGVLVMLQALICCLGVLIMGVQAVSAAALCFAAVVTSLAYLSIIYALSVTLQHIGKGICIVLVFAQIPGATGLYPIEMTSSFFQMVYPLLPFTYGITAMREAICGFYGTQYIGSLGVLALFFALFMAGGVALRPLLSNVNRMVALQIRRSGLYNGEDVEAPLRPFRFSQIVRALSEKAEYRSELLRRYDRLMRAYPQILRAVALVGLAVPVALGVVFALIGGEKVVLLTLWLAWLAIVLLFLVVLESLRFSLQRQMRLDAMSDEGLRALYGARKAMPVSGDGAGPGEEGAPSAEPGDAETGEGAHA